jgi:hypothetical protein
MDRLDLGGSFVSRERERDESKGFLKRHFKQLDIQSVYCWCLLNVSHMNPTNRSQASDSLSLSLPLFFSHCDFFFPLHDHGEVSFGSLNLTVIGVSLYVVKI